MLFFFIMIGTISVVVFLTIQLFQVPIVIDYYRI